MTIEEFNSLPKKKQKELVRLSYLNICTFIPDDKRFDIPKIVLYKFLHPYSKSKKSNNQTKGKGGTP